MTILMFTHTHTHTHTRTHARTHTHQRLDKFTILTFGNNCCLMAVLCTKEKSNGVHISCILINAAQIHCDITVNVVRLQVVASYVSTNISKHPFAHTNIKWITLMSIAACIDDYFTVKCFNGNRCVILYCS